MDLGDILKAPTRDPEWVSRFLLMGLIIMGMGAVLPGPGSILAGFVALGYTRACFESFLTSPEGRLPPVGVLEYIAPGFWVFVSMLPVFALLTAAGCVLAGCTFALVASEGSHSTFALIGVVASSVALLALAILSPAMMYRHFVHDERWASGDFAAHIALVSNYSGEYLTLLGAIFLSGLIAMMGCLALGLGMLITVPFAYAMQGAAFAAFARATHRA